MTAFSAGSVFGQAPFFGSTSVTTGPKMLQWNNQTKIDAPVNAGALAQGVKVTFSGSADGPTFTPVSPAVAISTTIPTTNPNQSSFWIGEDGKSLNIFASDQNRAAISFDISTKYLKNVKDLQIMLDANTFGDEANKNVNWDMHLQVYNLDGTLVDYNQIYQYAGTFVPGHMQWVQTGPMPWQGSMVWVPTDYQDMTMVYEGIYNTSMKAKTLKLFQLADDEIEDHPFIPNSLDNKIIRVTFVSDRPAGDVIDTAPAATIVKSLSIASDVPSMTLTRTAVYNGTGMFNAGMGYELENAANKVTVAVAGLSLYNTPVVDVTAPGGFVMHSSHDALGHVPMASASESAQYDFAPATINTFSGPFTAAAAFINHDVNNPLSPIVALTATSENVYGNSVPKVSFDKTKLTFEQNWSYQDIKVTGINIPYTDKGDFRWVGGYMDDQDDSAEAEAGVENHIAFDNLGKIVSPSSYIRVHFAQFLNNVDVNVAKYLKISRRYSIPNAIKGEDTFRGRESATFSNPNDNLVPFPQVLVVGDIAAVWFEYEGTDGAPAQIVGDISTAFYAPYDETLLPEQQAVSRTKAFYLKGAKVKPDANNVAKFEISLAKFAQHDNDGHLAFRYSVDNGATWNTPAVKKVISVTLNTQQEIADFQSKGVKILVQFKPDCDGFEVANYDEPRAHRELFFKWNPHFNLLKAEQVGQDRVGTGAIVFGDTRTNLENTIHDWNFVNVMQNSTQVWWSGALLTKSEFRKDYGNTYLGECGEQNNPNNEGVFYVTGYNLTKNVNIKQAIDANYTLDKKAFFVTVEAQEGFGTVNGLEIEPNQYGEVLAKVTVTFEPSVKVPGYRAVNEFITVEYKGRTIEDGRRWWDAEFNYVDILMNHHEDNAFIYPRYEYPQATLCGRVYEPTFNKVNVTNMQSTINVPVTQQFTFSATDLDKSKGTVKIALNKGANSPFKIAPSEFTIDDNGNASGTVTLTFKPDSTTIANCEYAVDAMTYTYGDCTNADLAFSGVEGITVVGQPTFGAFQAGDIQGDRVDLRVTPAKGGNNYVVGIGILKYNKKTSSIFMSEVYAKDNVTYVELFNGTGETLNYDIISEDSPNYYMEVWEGTTKKQTIILGATDAALWTPYGIIVKTINYTLASDKEYTLVLKQGQITLDVYKFTGDVTHKTRKDDLAASAYKVSAFNEADWTTVGGWHTSLNATVQKALYASMFHDERPAANFKQYFADVTVERAQYGFQTGLSVNNLKKGVTYTAYAYTEPTCDGVTVTTHPAVKLVAASDSYRVDGDPMDGVTFGYFTGIDQVEVAKNIYAVNGKIYVVGATEAVTIFNALGMQVKAASIEEAAAGIDVANGIYMVKSGSKTAKVLVNR
ncbi:hypothetical protein A9168_04410 [Macellibacteroides sp. HH-ZS]|nr:hypothetical protein A9168_04410 [Macellibacteroides sp. HH-ZS]